MSILFRRLFTSNGTKRGIMSAFSGLRFNSSRRFATMTEIDDLWKQVEGEADSAVWPQLPKEGIRFRIVAPSGKIIKVSGENVFLEDGESLSVDQYFYAEEYSSSTFGLRHHTTNRYLIVAYNNNNYVDVWADTSPDQVSHKSWRFEGELVPGKFMLKNERSTDADKPYMWENGTSLSLTDIERDTCYFRFEYEPFEILDVRFDVEGVEPEDDAEAVLVAEQTVDNTEGSEESQTMSFTFSKEISETSSFSHEAGASIEAGMTFTAKIPFVASTEVSASAGASYTYSWGEEKSISQGNEYTLSVTAGKQEKVKAQSSVRTAKVTIPYTMLCRTIRTGVPFVSTGYYNAVSAYDLVTKYSKSTTSA